MVMPGVGGQLFVPTTVHAQTAPTGSGFTINAEDLRFIYDQILVAQDHAAGGTLLGPGPNQVHDPQLPRGLRTVDGSFNNLVPIPDQHLFGASDQVFPRRTTPAFRAAEAGTSYAQTSGDVIDSQPRIATNLIVDQSAANPAAVAAATNPCGSGGFVCSTPTSLAAVTDPDSGALFIPNITPDFGLSAPFNLMFTFFGQFFDHGLDLVTKAGGTVVMPLQPDDPLFVPGSPTNFMVLTRAQNQPAPDGILGTADDVHEGTNTAPYGPFKPRPARGTPQMIRPGNILVEGNPAGGGVPVPADAFRTGHAFLNDIAHNAVPSPGLVPDADTTILDFRTGVQPAGT